MPLPERHFLGWTESAAHSVAQWLYQRRDTLATNQSGVLDFTNTLVIVPGAGARRHVLAALRKLVPGAMIPPSMATPGKFMLNAFATPRGSVVAGPLERLTAICMALAQNDALREQLLPSVSGTSLAALARPAKRLLDVIDRADDAHKSVQDISRLDILQASPSMAQSWENLEQLHVEMKHQLQDMGAILKVNMLERSDVIDLAATGWAPKCGALVLAGLPDFARNVSYASECLAKTQFNGQPVSVHALVLAPASEAAKFDHLGVVIGGDHGFTSGPDIQDSMIEVAGDPADQAAATVARYCKFTGAVDKGDTCIVLADESLLPNISRAFAQHGRGVHSGGGIRFAQTEVGQCLQRFEAAANNGQATQLIELVRVPAITRALAADGAHFTNQNPIQTLEKIAVDCKATSIEHLWSQVKAKEFTQDFARALETQVQEWFACMSPAANTQLPLGQRWGQLEQWVQNKFASNENQITARACAECVKTLQRAQESMAAEQLGSAPDALSLALLLCADIIVPDPSDAQCVDTVGWLETLFEPSEKFVLTGMFEGSLPSAPQVDGWFNESIRAAVGLPTRAARFARDAYLLSALAARAAVAQSGAAHKSNLQTGATQIHNSQTDATQKSNSQTDEAQKNNSQTDAAQKSNSQASPAHTGTSGLAVIAGQLGGDGDPLKPSRLLLPKDELAIAKRILLLLPNDADGVAIKRMRPKVAHSAALSSAFSVKPQPRAQDANEKLRAISVTDFAVYIDNPYRYWLEKVLKLNAPELDQVELNAAEFGTLLHAAAQSLNTPAIQSLDFNSANYEKQCAHEMMQVTHERAQKNYGGDLSLSIRLALLELQNRLPALVAWHAAQLRAGWRIVATEWPPKGEHAVAMLDVDQSPQNITFRVDRIDYHPNHGWRIIDYKSSDGGYVVQGKGAKVVRGDKWIDLQLPLYKFLLPQIAGAHGELADMAQAASDAIEVGVLSVPASNLAPEWCPLQTPIDGAIAEAKRIVREIRAGNFPDSGRDPSGKFERVRRALCLPMFGEESDDDQDNEGAAT